MNNKSLYLAVALLFFLIALFSCVNTQLKKESLENEIVVPFETQEKDNKTEPQPKEIVKNVSSKFEKVDICFGENEWLTYNNSEICYHQICSNYCEVHYYDWIKIEFFFNNTYNRTLFYLVPEALCYVNDEKVPVYGGLWQMTDKSLISFPPRSRRFITQMLPGGYVKYLWVFKANELLGQGQEEIMHCDIYYKENLKEIIKQESFDLKIVRSKTLAD